MKLSDKMWSWIGKIALIVGLIWGVIKIIDYFTQDYSLHAYGEYIPVNLPDKIYEDLEKFFSCSDDYDDIFELSKLNQMINEAIDPENKIPDIKGIVLSENQLQSLRQILIVRLCNYFTDKFPTDKLEQLYEFNSMYKIQIINDGNKEINGIRLELPFSGLYLISKSETIERENIDIRNLKFIRALKLLRGESDMSNPYISEVQPFDKEIILGTLRPSNQIYVFIWFESFRSDIYLKSNNNIIITHPNGSIRVEFSTKVRGIFAWLDQNWPHWFFFSLVMLGMVSLLILIIVSTIKKKSNSKSD